MIDDTDDIPLAEHVCTCDLLQPPFHTLPEISPGVRVCGWCKNTFFEDGEPAFFDLKAGADALCAVEELPTILNL